MFINSNLKSSRRMLNANLVKEDIEAYEEEYGVMDRDELLTFLFGDMHNYPSTSFDLYIMVGSDKKWWHRLNMLWAFPLTLLFSPYSWIKHGEIGWTNKSTLGAIVLKCVGEDK